jgi:hypothetical protein
VSIEDYQINATVRRILARCWVDLEALRYGTVGRTVYFHGRFEKVRATRERESEAWQGRRPDEIAETLALLEAVEKEVRREPLVLDLVFRLENFRKSQGKWSTKGV